MVGNTTCACLEPTASPILVPSPSRSYSGTEPACQGRRAHECPTFFSRARARTRKKRCHTLCISEATSLCAARLRDGTRCLSVPTAGDLCAHHARCADEQGREAVLNGDGSKRRSARFRTPVAAETEPLQPAQPSSPLPSSVRPALAVTAAEEVETIRRVLLEAATNTTRDSWATCTCPECGKSFRQEILVPDHGARIKAVETLLREGLGRVGEAPEGPPATLPRDPEDIEKLSWSQMRALAEVYEPDLVRLEISALSDAQRGLLQEALAAAG